MKKNGSLPYLLLIIAVSFFAFFANGSLLPVMGAEAENLVMAREMVGSGQYIVPTLNGEPVAGRAPLPVWIAAGVERALPGNPGAQRSAAGLGAILMLFFLYGIVYRLSGSRNIAVTAALIFATCYVTVTEGRTAGWDVCAHTFILGGLYMYVRGLSAKGRAIGWMVLSGVLFGCALLSRGVVPFITITLPFLLAYGLVIRPRTVGKGPGLLLLLAMALAVSAWWFVLMRLEGCGTAALFYREPGTAQPALYYWRFPAAAGIWTLFWITSIVWFFWRRRPGRHRRLFAFSMTWFLLSFAVITIMPDRQLRYLLPAMLPGSVVIAMYLWNLARNPTTRTDRFVFRLNVWLVALVLCAAAYLSFTVNDVLSAAGVTAAGICFLLLAVIMVTGMYRRGGGIGFKRIFASMVLATVTVVSFILPELANPTEDPLPEQVARTRGLPFYHEAGKPVSPELLYLLGHPVPSLNPADSLFFGKLPFAFISSMPADSFFGAGVDTQLLVTGQDYRYRKFSGKDTDRFYIFVVSSQPVAEETSEEDN